ncbi:MAG: beta-propeller domain-containing protein [Planctomycetota bacterium]
MPHWFETDPVTGLSTRSGWLPGSPGRCYRSPDDQGTNTTVIMTLDTAHLQAEPNAALVAGWHHETYVSSTTIYLASEIYKPAPTAEDGYDLRQRTLVKALTLDDLSPLGCGSVWGRPLSRWAFGEHERTLRIATTTGWGDAMRNHLFSLRPDGEGSLATVGSIEDLAPGQRIYAVRYRGTWAYVVTYRQVDPLHVIDVSDPTAPIERGELWLPGFSDYLHPIGDGLLIGLGENESGQTKLSLFDVSDPTTPVERHSHVLGSGYLWSEARRDHRAFAYRSSDGLLALPYVEGTYTITDLGHYHCYYQYGAMIIAIDPEQGFTTRGRIDFSEDDYPYRSRAILIDDHGFAVCPLQLATSPLTGLETEPERLDLPAVGD